MNVRFSCQSPVFETTVVPVESDEPVLNSPVHEAVDEDWSEQDLEALYPTDSGSRRCGYGGTCRGSSVNRDDEACQESPVLDTPDAITDSPAERERDSREDPEERICITARQVVEAVMIVGGGPVTGKQLAELLGGESTHELVDDVIESLNTLYVSQSRPYEIRLIEGGYQLTLRREYDRVRHRVYGLGPQRGQAVAGRTRVTGSCRVSAANLKSGD